jgi:formylglycine-generating enzyme required for sulfatase activity
MAFVQRACMDRYEAHLLLRSELGGDLRHPPNKRPIGGRFVAAVDAGVKPQAYISQLEAADACKNAGKRLCSAVEWYGACTSNAPRTYPYGTTYVAGRCNVGKAHLLSILHGADSRSWRYADFNDPKLSEQPGFLALTGEFAGCTTPSGVYDLVGNLHEWVADRVDATLPSKLPLPAIIGRHIGTSPGKGIFMGGFYSTTNEHGAGCNFVTAAHEPGYHDYSTGFRCCRDL